MRALDRKLAAIREGAYTPNDFILADAKDGDMAMGVAAPGPVRPNSPSPSRNPGRASGGYDQVSASTTFKTRRAYLDAMAANVHQGEIDILLASASNAERLTNEGVFEGSPVTLAVRVNDTSDIWLPRGSSYAREPSRPFRTAALDMVRPFCDLGMFSMTLNNDLTHDHASFEAYARFRDEARRLDLRHFLEVFNPNAPANLSPEELPFFVNDSIIRALAGVTSAERPLFLKIAYNGPQALEELASHDPSLVVGILGGGAGTTRDTYELLHQAERHGARVALFGRKINLAEAPLDLVALMRPVLRRELTPNEAVRAYHAALEKRGLSPLRSLEDDLVVSEPTLKDG